jgi:glucose-6-phosphate 1-epimerase
MSQTKPEAKGTSGSAGRVSFMEGRGELPMLEVSTPSSSAEIYLQGAHVTHFKKKDEAPLLFLSQCSRFSPGEPIRGGIPVIFPWFGPREGLPQHGFARLKTWGLKEVAPSANGIVTLQFQLPDCPEASAFPTCTAVYKVSVDDSLTLELTVSNESDEDVFTFENCLHTYFEVSDINEVSITGLKGVKYLDKVAGYARKTETNEAIRIAAEVDRVYLDTTSPVEIVDLRLGRKIRIEKEGSTSTVVWNPWVPKSHQMPDFGNDEYLRMVCVESGNVAANAVKLEPGKSSNLKVKISSQAV